MPKKLPNPRGERPAPSLLDNFTTHHELDRGGCEAVNLAPRNPAAIR
ncbi:hypothetical protein HQ447_01125 [bacterium]|nr:hypothetical protein [bacterium]